MYQIAVHSKPETRGIYLFKTTNNFRNKIANLSIFERKQTRRSEVTHTAISNEIWKQTESWPRKHISRHIVRAVALLASGLTMNHRGYFRRDGQGKTIARNNGRPVSRGCYRY